VFFIRKSIRQNHPCGIVNSSFLKRSNAQQFIVESLHIRMIRQDGYNNVTHFGQNCAKQNFGRPEGDACASPVRNRKTFLYRAKRDRKVPASVGGDSCWADKKTLIVSCIANDYLEVKKHPLKLGCFTVCHFGDFHAINLCRSNGVSRSYNLNKGTDLVTCLKEKSEIMILEIRYYGDRLISLSLFV
jgi:hypothetical protein